MSFSHDPTLAIEELTKELKVHHEVVEKNTFVSWVLSGVIILVGILNLLLKV